MTDNNLYTDCLREDVRIWKKEIGATYEDISDIAECSKSHVYEFIKGKKSVSYELGKRFEMIVTTWSLEIYAKYKAQKMIEKKEELKQDD